jgi:cathepsin C
MRSFGNVVLIAVTLGLAAADLPVHCLKSQVEGEWDFTLSPLSNKRSSCGHQRPDIEEDQPNRVLISSVNGGKTSSKRVALHSPNVAKTEGDVKGTWTMVYDEGFEVTVDGLNFLAFSNFTYEMDAKTQKKNNVSHCGDTMVGWYHNAARTQFGCYYGVKVEKQVAKPIPAAPSAVKPAEQMQHDHTKLTSKTMAKKVAKLNAKLSMLQLGWKARTVEKFIGKTMHEINSYAGIQRNSRAVHKDMLSQRQQQRGRSFLQKTRASKFPESFDWSNASGVDWLEPVMDQADCGRWDVSSCMRML